MFCKLEDIMVGARDLRDIGNNIISVFLHSKFLDYVDCAVAPSFLSKSRATGVRFVAEHGSGMILGSLLR